MTSVTTKLAGSLDTPSPREKEQEAVARDREFKHKQGIQSLDRKTLAIIYDDYQPLLYSYIYRRTGEVEVARDLTAEVFGRFLQAVGKGKGPGDNMRAWFYRVAHNIVVDHYRRQQHRNHVPLNDRALITNDGPDAAVEREMQSEKLRSALSQLTADQQQVISLKFLEGLSNQEVAAVLDKPVGAVKSLQHRALAALHRHLDQVKEEVLP